MLHCLLRDLQINQRIIVYSSFYHLNSTFYDRRKFQVREKYLHTPIIRNLHPCIILLRPLGSLVNRSLIHSVSGPSSPQIHPGIRLGSSAPLRKLVHRPWVNDPTFKTTSPSSQTILLPSWEQNLLNPLTCPVFLSQRPRPYIQKMITHCLMMFKSSNFLWVSRPPVFRYVPDDSGDGSQSVSDFHN